MGGERENILIIQYTAQLRYTTIVYLWFYRFQKGQYIEPWIWGHLGIYGNTDIDKSNP